MLIVVVESLHLRFGQLSQPTIAQSQGLSQESVNAYVRRF
jgi:hypothetical protein